ncbi:MAG TPA: hypothetical protein VKI64_04390 [Acidimicrobiales bacterium]|nr:hypothetical protein [Acidimicrobiales bacterium]
MLLAELEVRHSRAIAPTRRVALGELWLPTDPAPGAGGVLLAGIVAGFGGALDDDTRDALERLIADLELGRRIVQPRLRHRFQTDVAGLDRSRHQLTAIGEAMSLGLDDHGAALPQVLAAVYAAGKLSSRSRPLVFRLLRRATRWQGEADEELMRYLSGDDAAFRVRRGVRHGPGWALALLGFGAGAEPARGEVMRRFRVLVRSAHPDHGGDSDRAGSRIHDLTEAKRILLGGE